MTSQFISNFFPMSEDPLITMNTQNQRFELPVGNDMAYIQYRIHQGSLILLYIFVPVSYRGKGYSSTLIRHAVQYADNNTLELDIKCSFIARYLALHPGLLKTTG